MAKGDDARSRNAVTYQGNLAQNNLNNLRTDTLVPQNQTMWNNYLNANQQNAAERTNVNSQFQNFADTGGFSNMDLANIRARSVSPIRAVYANANRDIDRQRALQGGYSPGYGTLKARMAREMSSGLSDATTNSEGQIAQMRQQGKQYGTSGLASMYSATPGLTNMAGGQVLDSTGQRIQGEQLQGALSGDIMRNTIAASQLPGKFDSTLKDIQGIADIGSSVGSTIYPWLKPTQEILGGSSKARAGLTPQQTFQAGML